MGAYPGAGTTIGPAPGLYALSPSMSVTQINSLFSNLGAANYTGTVIIPDGVTQGRGSSIQTWAPIPYALAMFTSKAQVMAWHAMARV